jgi:hypothetical protein
MSDDDTSVVVVVVSQIHVLLVRNDTLAAINDATSAGGVLSDSQRQVIASMHGWKRLFASVPSNDTLPS